MYAHNGGDHLGKYDGIVDWRKKNKYINKKKTKMFLQAWIEIQFFSDSNLYRGK